MSDYRFLVTITGPFSSPQPQADRYQPMLRSGPRMKVARWVTTICPDACPVNVQDFPGYLTGLDASAAATQTRPRGWGDSSQRIERSTRAPIGQIPDLRQQLFQERGGGAVSEVMPRIAAASTEDAASFERGAPLASSSSRLHRGSTDLRTAKHGQDASIANAPADKPT